jgi:hypothetical protein
MEQQNALLIECVLKIDDWDEFCRLMMNEEWQVVSSKIYHLEGND